MDQTGCYFSLVFIVVVVVAVYFFNFVCLFFLFDFLVLQLLTCPYFYCSAVIMFVVRPNEVNIFDQRILEYRIKER